MIPIDEVVYFDVITESSTGAATDADSTPTFDVYEEATDTGLLGATNLTKRTSLTGNYRGTFTASAANGFETGKWYSVIVSATIGGVATKQAAMLFSIGPDNVALKALIDAVDDFIDTEVAAIKAKTDNLPADPADASDVAAAIAALNDLSAAEVNAEVVDALATDTYAEPSGVPGATITLATKIGWLYMALRNGITITSSKKTFMDDGGAAEWEKDLSDDGSTYTESEGNAI